MHAYIKLFLFAPVSLFSCPLAMTGALAYTLKAILDQKKDLKNGILDANALESMLEGFKGVVEKGWTSG